jgi:uncharacterized protein
MKRISGKKVRIWLIVLLAIYVLGGALIYFFQDKMLFRAMKLPADHKFSFSQPFKEINLAVTTEKNLSIVQFTIPDSICKGVVLYFHGNKSNIERYAPFASNFTKHNYEVWMMDYPGYGKSTGERTESILYEDALTLYRMARSRFSKDSIILYGRSLGTGIASQLASVRNAKRLILETPYYDFPSLLNQYIPAYPTGWLLRYEFPNHKYLQKVTDPVTIFHGTEDRVIRYRNARKLLPFLKKGDEFITIRGGQHNNLYDFKQITQKLDSLLAL